MTDSIRSTAPTLPLHPRAAAPTAAAAQLASIASAAPIASGDGYTPSDAAAPSLRHHLTALSVNGAALSTLGAVDSLLAAHYGAVVASGEDH